SLRPDNDFHLIDPHNASRYREYVSTYRDFAERHEITPSLARTLVRTSATVISALMVRRGDADAMLCGLEGRFNLHRRHIEHIIGMMPGATSPYAVSLLITS